LSRKTCPEVTISAAYEDPGVVLVFTMTPAAAPGRLASWLATRAAMLPSPVSGRWTNRATTFPPVF
ncbi:MAG TPA: hypothetical protein VF940_26730, partial [Streptosporangiaceae bacterium]